MRTRDELANHVMMLESDSGTFRPSGFGLSANERARATVPRLQAFWTQCGCRRSKTAAAVPISVPVFVRPHPEHVARGG